MVAKNRWDLRDSRLLPGVDGIPPNLLMEIVEQISTPCSVQFVITGGIVPLEWKKQTTYHYLKQFEKQIK